MQPDTRFEAYLCLHDMPVTVFLTNGVKLVGSINHVLQNGDFFLSRDGASQKVTRTALATILPHGNMSTDEVQQLHQEQCATKRGGL